MLVTTELNEISPADHNFLQIDQDVLRDYFAGQALAGMLGRENIAAYANVAENCRLAYSYADQMLKQKYA